MGINENERKDKEKKTTTAAIIIVPLGRISCMGRG